MRHIITQIKCLINCLCSTLEMTKKKVNCYYSVLKREKKEDSKNEIYNQTHYKETGNGRTRTNYQ